MAQADQPADAEHDGAGEHPRNDDQGDDLLPATAASWRDRWRPPLEFRQQVGRVVTASNVVAVATAINVLVAFVQWRALSAANRHAEATARVENRAWLTLTMGLRTEPTADQQLFVLPIPLSNTGKTPATRVRYRSRATLSSAPRGPAASDYVLNDWVHAGAVMPGELNRQVTVTRNFAPSDMADYLAGRTRYYLLLEVKYCDAFGEPHWLGVCSHHGYGESSFAYCGVSIDGPNSRRDYGECAGDDGTPNPSRESQ